MKKHLKTIILYLVLIAVVIFTVATIFRGTESEKLVLGDVVELFEANRVTEFVIEEE